MSLEEKYGALVKEMHVTAGERWVQCTEWIELAVLYPQLREALLAVFGGWMPTPSRIGTRFSERNGKHYGDFVLEGARHKTLKLWLWRAVSLTKLAERAADREAQYEEAQRRHREAVERQQCDYTATVQATAQLGRDEALKATAQFERTDTVPEVLAIEPEPVVSEQQRITADGPYRQPTRAELAARHAALVGSERRHVFPSNGADTYDSR